MTDTVEATRVSEYGHSVAFIYSQRGCRAWAMKVDAEGKCVTRYKIRTPIADGIDHAVKLFSEGLPVTRLDRLPRLPRARYTK